MNNTIKTSKTVSKNKVFILLILCLSMMALVACANNDNHNTINNPNDLIEPSPNITDDQQDNKNEKDKDNSAEIENEIDDIKEDELDKEDELPTFSQLNSKFPWEKDENFIKAQTTNDTDVLIAGFVTVFEDYTPEEATNIGLAASVISGTVLKPGEIFSQNNTAGPYSAEQGYQQGNGYSNGKVVKVIGGGVCKVATTIYNTTIASNLEIVERYNHSMPVPYVPYGQDAAVATGYKDFKFRNNTEHTLLMWAELVENRLYMGFYGKEEAPEVIWHHETLSETETSTKFLINSELADGEEKVLVNGMNGKIVTSSITIKYKDGEEKTKNLGKSSYTPLITLIEKNK